MKRQKQPTVIIDDDLGLILNCAVRYAMGRRTYVPSSVTGFIRPLIHHLSNRTISVMERDIAERGSDPLYKDEPYGDPNIDAPVWIGLLEELRKEIVRRKEGGMYF